jgi:RNA polymerase subunit RPABC4/transcription elongation factor Spt4
MRSVFPKSLTRLWFGLLVKLGSYRIAIGLGSAGLLVIVRREESQIALA